MQTVFIICVIVFLTVFLFLTWLGNKVKEDTCKRCTIYRHRKELNNLCKDCPNNGDPINMAIKYLTENKPL